MRISESMYQRMPPELKALFVQCPNGSPEVMALFPETKSGGYPAEGGQRSHGSVYSEPNKRGEQRFTASEGSAARFFPQLTDDLRRGFYTGKASKADRGTVTRTAAPLFAEPETKYKNTHPTVKPTDLMEWLCCFTMTPTGGTVLDPFMGSGSTLVACKRLGRSAIGIELDEASCETAAHRLRNTRTV